MEPVIFTGFIYRDEDGIYVSHCNELDIETCAHTQEDIERRTKSMIRSYFVACQKSGNLESLLTRLNIPQRDIDPTSLPIETNFEYKPAQI